MAAAQGPERIFTRCLIVGDSHIARLDRDLKNGVLRDGNMEISGVKVYFHGISSRTVELILSRDMTTIQAYFPEVVFLHVGGNDLTSDEDSPVITAHDLIRLAGKLLDLQCVQHVIISRLCWRHQPSRLPVPMNFVSQSLETNAYLSQQTQALSRVHVWSHQFSCGPQALSDGVHFLPGPQSRFCRSIRACLEMATKGFFVWGAKPQDSAN